VDAGQLGGARIVKAACGYCHNVVVSAEGRVWTFGDGWNGRLGHNDEQQRLVPTLLTAEVFKGSKIVTVAAGGAHTMAVGVNGTLWAWGLGSSSSWAWATPMKGGCRRWWVRRRCLGVPRCARLPADVTTRWR